MSPNPGGCSGWYIISGRLDPQQPAGAAHTLRDQAPAYVPSAWQNGFTALLSSASSYVMLAYAGHQWKKRAKESGLSSVVSAQESIHYTYSRYTVVDLNKMRQSAVGRTVEALRS